MYLDIERIKWGLEELSDKAMQTRLWMNAGGEASSFEEAVCCIFDDSGLGKLLDSDSVPMCIPSHQIDKLKRLSKITGLFPVQNHPEDIINHPDMKDIRFLASEILMNWDMQ